MYKYNISFDKILVDSEHFYISFILYKSKANRITSCNFQSFNSLLMFNYNYSHKRSIKGILGSIHLANLKYGKSKCFMNPSNP